jgi:hypothetical protein
MYLSEAIAELESQEPVGVVNINDEGDWYFLPLVSTDDLLEGTKFYTRPPQRTWADLTRTQIQDVYFEVLKEHRGGHQIQGQLAFGEALQAKIKEKNI